MADWVRLGDRAIRFARPAGVHAQQLVQAARAWPGAVDVVVARDDMAVYFTGEPRVTRAQIAALATTTDEPPQARRHVLHAVYDGPDLDSVSAAIGLSVDDVIAIHVAGEYIVETMGFLPGFAYMTGLDPRLVVPRRATPRTRVPAGSIAIAGEHTSVYPLASPGGWHLIGRVVDVRMFGPEGPLLGLGDTVRFER
jgi:KipI family sensor histidine kinase inhibitor